MEIAKSDSNPSVRREAVIALDSVFSVIKEFRGLSPTFGKDVERDIASTMREIAEKDTNNNVRVEADSLLLRIEPKGEPIPKGAEVEKITPVEGEPIIQVKAEQPQGNGLAFHERFQ